MCPNEKMNNKNIPWLYSDNFLKRSLSIWFHSMVGGVVVAIVLILIAIGLVLHGDLPSLDPFS